MFLQMTWWVAQIITSKVVKSDPNIIFQTSEPSLCIFVCVNTYLIKVTRLKATTYHGSIFGSHNTTFLASLAYLAYTQLR